MTWRGTAQCLVGVFLIAACSGGTPVEVPLAHLVAEQETYDGQALTTEGTVVAVRDFATADDYFVLQDAAENRVRLVPDEAAAPHDGDTVAVTGSFRFDEQSGRHLTVEQINVVP